MGPLGVQRARADTARSQGWTEPSFTRTDKRRIKPEKSWSSPLTPIGRRFRDHPVGRSSLSRPPTPVGRACRDHPRRSVELVETTHAGWSRVSTSSTSRHSGSTRSTGLHREFRHAQPAEGFDKLNQPRVCHAQPAKGFDKLNQPRVSTRSTSRGFRHAQPSGATTGSGGWVVPSGSTGEQPRARRPGRWRWRRRAASSAGPRRHRPSRSAGHPAACHR